MVPVTVRVLLALALAVVLLPVATPPQPVSPFSLLGIVTTVEQVAIGLIIGLGFQMVMAVFAAGYYMASSQMGLAMAQMNDPMSAPRPTVSALIYVLAILIFFAVDGHLVFNGVVGASFTAGRWARASRARPWWCCRCRWAGCSRPRCCSRCR